MYAMTADLIRIDQVEKLGFNPPIIYIDVGIREQHLLAMAHGISQTDTRSRILINTADAFLYRGLDQLNAIAQGESPMVIFSDHGGLSAGRNGSTHQSSGQPGALLNMPGVKYYEPADVRDLFNCLNEAISVYGKPSYIRLHVRDTFELKRVNGDILNTKFYEVGTNSTKEADCILVSSGLTTQGAVEAQEILKHKYNKKAKVVNVIDPMSIDSEFVKLLEPGKPVLTVYNGNEYTLRSAVASAILQSNLNVRPSSVKGHGFEVGTSGNLTDLIRYFKFDGDGIVEVLQMNFPDLFE